MEDTGVKPIIVEEPIKKSFINPEREKLMQTPIKKEDKQKKNYKDEKNAKKNLKKTLDYKESYKAKERDRAYEKSNYTRVDSSLVIKLDLCDDIILILKDKIKNDKIQLSSFELKTINKFFKEFDIKESRENKNVTILNSACNVGDKCIVWYCKFTHNKERPSECKCIDKDCNKLHIHLAICKNPNHQDDCKIAHRISDLK